MALQEIECLWDERWIKNLMASMRLENMNMASYVGTTSSSSPWTTYKDYYEKEESPPEEIVKRVEGNPEIIEPVLFDPKELDIDVKG